MDFSQRILALKNKWRFFRNEKITRTRIIILPLPSMDLISGGIMSVISIYRELKKREDQLGIHVFLSTHPQAPHFEGYTKHNRDVKIYGFHQLISRLLPNSTILFHITEAHVIQFCSGLRHEELDRLKKEKNLVYDINILNQNPEYFPVKEDLIPLLTRIREVTQTTAHYACDKPFLLGDKTIPSSYLGTPAGIDVFEHVPFHAKRNAILVSHDDHPEKERILRSLQRAIPDLEVIVVHNMSFEEYTDHQKYCKFGLTFGEGMDAYFIRCILYGGIGFAVNNETFFTDDIRAFPTVFDSYEQLHANIASLIQQLNAPDPYTVLVSAIRPIIGKYYNNACYQQRMEHIHTNWLNDLGCIATQEILGEVAKTELPSIDTADQ